MKISTLREEGLRAILGGENSMEYRDRVVGLVLTVIGLVALSFVPEYRELQGQFHTNFLGPEMIFRSLLFLSTLAIIGPCLLLPYRYGAVPFVVAIAWSAYHLNLELRELPQSANAQISEVRVAQDSLNRITLGR